MKDMFSDVKSWKVLVIFKTQILKHIGFNDMSTDSQDVLYFCFLNIVRRVFHEA